MTRITTTEKTETEFKPNTIKRFICLFGNLEISEWAVRSVILPTISKDISKGAIMTVQLYDMITPSISRELYKAVFDETKFDLEFKQLDSLGTVVSNIVFPNTEVISYEYEQFNYSSNEPSYITAQLKIRKIELKEIK